MSVPEEHRDAEKPNVPDYALDLLIAYVILSAVGGGIALASQNTALGALILLLTFAANLYVFLSIVRDMIEDFLVYYHHTNHDDSGGIEGFKRG